MEIKPVLFSEESVGPMALGLVELNRPKALNALNEGIFKSLKERLSEWAEDPNIAAVVIHSNQDKAFCAGGDVKSLVLNFQGQKDFAGAKSFFQHEYFVDHMIHSYPKPVVVWGDGLIMGGGVGLSQGAKFRVVTEKSTLSMPEINIGFFPDVGASHFLSGLPEGAGLFLGMTSYRLTGEEAIQLGLADYFLSSESKRKVLVDLLRQPWQPQIEDNQEILESYFKKVAKTSFERDFFLENKNSLEVCQGLSKAVDWQAFEVTLSQTLRGSPERQATQDRFSTASPLSRRFVAEQMKRGAQWELKETFIKEWDIALNFCESSDFAEGVRARLIDKDQNPQWSHESMAEVTQAELEALFKERPGAENHLRPWLE